MIRTAKGEALERNVIVWDEGEANWLYFLGFYGKPIKVKKPRGSFQGALVLDPIESLYLVERGRLKVIKDGKEVGFDELFNLFSSKYENLKDKYNVYRYLRDLGYVVLPGIKFGGDFAVYKRGPGIEHAPYILKVIKEDQELQASDIVLAGRLATSVKKKYIFAVPGNPPALIGLEWWKG